MESIPKQWRITGARITRLQRGASPATIFLHGFGGRSADWLPIWSALPPGLSTLAYDLRGFGESVADDDTPFSHTDDLAALLDAEGLADADIVGMSMGGGIALHFALGYPERVRRLVLISPDMMGWDWSEDWRILSRAIRASAKAGDMAGAKRLWADHPLFAPTRADAATEEVLLEGIEAFSGAQWMADHQLPILPDVDRLPTLSCPTLLLTGERDLPDFRLIADLIEGAGQDVRRIDMAGRGHMLTLEVPRECAEAISNFLS